MVVCFESVVGEEIVGLVLRMDKSFCLCLPVRLRFDTKAE